MWTVLETSTTLPFSLPWSSEGQRKRVYLLCLLCKNFCNLKNAMRCEDLLIGKALMQLSLTLFLLQYQIIKMANRK